MSGKAFRAGDPRRTRMRVMKINQRWRVSEMCQPGQLYSTHIAVTFPGHAGAMRWAYTCASKDRIRAEKYGPDRSLWPSKRRLRNADRP